MVMRTEKWLALCVVLLLIQLVACERGKMEENAPAPVSARTGADSLGIDSLKNDSIPTDSTNRYITVDKVTGIKLKEPMLFTLVNGKSKFVKWAVIPQQTTINNGAQTTILFQKSGKFRVFAIDSLSYDSTFIDVQVDNELYVKPNYDQTIQPGDQVFITPKVISDSLHYLEFNMVSEKEYDCSNSQFTITVNSFQNPTWFKINGVSPGDQCAPGKTKAHYKLPFYTLPENYQGDFEIIYGTKTYKGSMLKKGLHYEFNWPYDTGVVFTKKSL